MPVGPTTTGTSNELVVAAEVPRQLLSFDEQPGGAPVRTRDRFLRGFEVGEQAALLGDVQDVSEAHGGVAGERGGGLFQRSIAAVQETLAALAENRGGRAPGGHLDWHGGDAQAS